MIPSRHGYLHPQSLERSSEGPLCRGPGGRRPSTLSHNSTLMIVYDILGYLHGELGNSTKMPVRLVALSAQLMEGDGIPPVTKSVTLLGNSRMAQAGVQYPPNLGLGIGSRLVAQGAANSLPEDVRVQNRSVGGEGIGMANLISELGLSDNTCPAASPCTTTTSSAARRLPLSF